jgi:hypothetical protein
LPCLQRPLLLGIGFSGNPRRVRLEALPSRSKRGRSVISREQALLPISHLPHRQVRLSKRYLLLERRERRARAARNRRPCNELPLDPNLKRLRQRLLPTKPHTSKRLIPSCRGQPTRNSRLPCQGAQAPAKACARRPSREQGNRALTTGPVDLSAKSILERIVATTQPDKPVNASRHVSERGSR